MSIMHHHRVEFCCHLQVHHPPGIGGVRLGVHTALTVIEISDFHYTVHSFVCCPFAVWVAKGRALVGWLIQGQIASWKMRGRPRYSFSILLKNREAYVIVQHLFWRLSVHHPQFYRGFFPIVRNVFPFLHFMR